MKKSTVNSFLLDSVNFSVEQANENTKNSNNVFENVIFQPSSA